MKPFVNKYRLERINHPSKKKKKMIRKKLRKTIKLLLLIFCLLKMRKYILPTFQNITRSAKNKSFF